MDVDHFRQVHLDLLARSPNCSEGHAWIWRQFGQCLERTEQIVGFVFGILVVFLWTAAHVKFYKLQRQRARAERLCNIRVFLAVHWSSEVLGCIGAGLAQQLTTQIIFCLSAVFVNTVCSIHYLVVPLTQKRSYTKLRVFRTQNLSSRLMKCLFPLVTISSLLSMVGITTSSSVAVREILVVDIAKPYINLIWVVGYTFGSFAALLYCSAKLIEVCESYTATECNKVIGIVYTTSITADLAYIFSVWTQSQSLRFFTHSLPWTLPRLLCAGLDCGILIQRIIQQTRTKRRKLSKEDTACLMSSESEGADVSSSEGEEIIWMPLKTVEIPQHPVTASRIQILSDSDGVCDKVDYLCDSGQFSMSDAGGTFFDQELMAAETTPNKGDNEQEEFFTAETELYNATEISNETAVGAVLITAQSDKSQTNTESDESSTTDEDGKKLLERQISNLSSVSSEEKIAVWIQSSSETSEQNIGDNI